MRTKASQVVAGGLAAALWVAAPTAAASSCPYGDPHGPRPPTSPEAVIESGEASRVTQLVSVREDPAIPEDPYIGTVRVVVAFGTEPAESEFELRGRHLGAGLLSPADVGTRYFFEGERPSACRFRVAWPQDHPTDRLIDLAEAEGVAVYAVSEPAGTWSLLAVVTLATAALAVGVAALMIARRSSRPVRDRLPQ